MIKIVCFFNDAGPANNITSLIKHYKLEYNWSLYCLNDSPAYKIFTNAKFQIKILKQQSSKHIQNILQIENPTFLIVGTGWQNTIHLKFIHAAKNLCIPSVATLDHWTNYKQRFNFPKSNWKNNISNYLVVNDLYAYNLAKEAGYKNVIKLRFYNLLHDIKIFKSTTIKETNNILFISEPTQNVAFKTYGNENHWGFSEFNVCEHICNYINIFETKKLTIRLHPSDQLQKYDYLINKYPKLDINVENPYQQTLINSLINHRIIIGIDGFVLYEAMILGKISISLIPSLKRDCQVPLFKENKVRSLKNYSLSSLKIKNQIQQAESFGITFAQLINIIINKEAI